MDSRRLPGMVLAFVAVLPSAAAQQPSDYVLVGRAVSYPGTDKSLTVFDRELESLNHFDDATSSWALTNPDGTRWISGSPSGLLHLGADAKPIGALAVGSLSLIPALRADGDLLIGSFTGLTRWTPEGLALWSVPWPTQFEKKGWVAVDAQGDVRVGGAGPDVFAFGGPSMLARFAGSDGALLGSLFYPLDNPTGGHQILQVRGAPDGTIWCNDGWFNPEPMYYGGAKLLNFTRETLVGSLKYGLHGEMSLSNPSFCVDALGRLLVPDFDQVGFIAKPEKTVFRYDPLQPAAPEAAWDVGGQLVGFELGVTGEELFTVTSDGGSPLRTYRLLRLNLVSGVRSSVIVGVEPAGSGGGHHWLARGDPTGFVFANTTDRTSDADGDGGTNGDETAAGSNPFDPESRPDGPKVYVAFAPVTNAIEMTLFDPDGLRHPTKGIDFGTMTVTIGGSGNVFWPLLSLVTEASLSADGKTAHAVFGGLPLANDLKLRVEMTVRDRTGAIGWDWQATPPGDL